MNAIVLALLAQAGSANEEIEYRLRAPGALDSKEFALHGAISDATVRWRPARVGFRVLGIASASVGALAYGAGLAIAFFALYSGLSSSFNQMPSFTSLDWTWSAIPIGLGGFAVLALGMTVLFRFGVERLSVEVAPPEARGDGR